MGGLDGHLHELCYAPSASLWAKRCFQVRASMYGVLCLAQASGYGCDVDSHHGPAPSTTAMLQSAMMPLLQTGFIIWKGVGCIWSASILGCIGSVLWVKPGLDTERAERQLV